MREDGRLQEPCGKQQSKAVLESDSIHTHVFLWGNAQTKENRR